AAAHTNTPGMPPSSIRLSGADPGTQACATGKLAPGHPPGFHSCTHRAQGPARSHIGLVSPLCRDTTADTAMSLTEIVLVNALSAVTILGMLAVCLRSRPAAAAL